MIQGEHTGEVCPLAAIRVASSFFITEVFSIDRGKVICDSLIVFII